MDRVNLDGMRGHRPDRTKIDRIRHYRETLAIGLAQAKRMVEREDLLAEIDAADSIYDVKAILRQMVGQL